MTLQLKVSLPNGKITTMRFGLQQSVGDVKQKIIEDCGVGGPDHALFIPPVTAVRTGQWLVDDRTLAYYDMKGGDDIVLRKKTAPKKFLMSDGSTKVILIDESLPVTKIVDIVLGEHMGITSPEEFAMMVEGAPYDEWLLGSKSLAEQGVPDDAILCIEKRFSYHDIRIDTSDPMQLHLIYLQAKKQITNGQHPMELSEAVPLAALQCQIQFGDYNPSKDHPPGFLAPKLPTLLPPTVFDPKKAKSSLVKSIEADIIKAWKNYVKLSPLNAKLRYVQLARSLATWGVVFYPVDEPIPESKQGKKRALMVGICRDSLIIAEPKTLKTINRIPLTHIKRWSPTAGTITIDYGSHGDDYFRAFTQYGDKISQMLSGYIDIILKVKTSGSVGSGHGSGSVAQPTRLQPPTGIGVVGTTLSRAGGGAGAMDPSMGLIGPDGNPIGYGYGQGQGYGLGGDMANAGGAYSGAQFVIDDLNSAIAGIDLLQNSLGAPLPEDYQNLSPEMAAQHYALANEGVRKGCALMIQQLGSMSQADMDNTGKYLYDNIAAMINAARRAGNNGDVNVSLLQGAMALGDAVAKILQCAKDVGQNPGDAAQMAKLANAMKLYNAATYSLDSAQRGVLADKASEELVLSSARLVFETAAMFGNACEQAGYTAAHLGPFKDQMALLLAAAASLSRGMIDPQCQEAMAELIATLHAQAGQLIQLGQQGGLPESALLSMSSCADNLTRALTMLQAVSKCPLSQDAELAFQTPDLVSKALDGIQSLLNATGQHAIMVNANAVEIQCHDVGRATMACGKLVPAGTIQNQLLGSAKAVVDTSSSCKQQAEQGNSGATFEGARYIQNQLYLISENSEVMSSYGRLLEQVKLSSAALAGMTALSMPVAAKSSDTALAAELLGKANATTADLVNLIPYIQHFTLDPSSPQNQKNLYMAARASTLPSSQMIAIATKVVPTINDPASKKKLNDACRSTNDALQKLLEACNDVADHLGGKGMNDSMQKLNQTLAQLNALIIAAQGGVMERNKPTDQAQAYAELRNTLIGAASALKELQTATVNDPDNAGKHAEKLADHINKLVPTAQILAETYPDRAAQTTLLQGAKNVAQQSHDFLVSVKGVLTDPSPALKVELEQTTVAITKAISELINSARSAGTGSGEECGKAAELISAELASARTEFQNGSADPNQLAYIRAVKSSKIGIATLEGALDQVGSLATTDPRGLALAAGSTGPAFANFVSATRSARSAAANPQIRNNIGELLLKVGEHSIQTVSTARSAKTDNNAALQMNVALASVKKSLDLLLNELDNGIPGKPQVLQALQMIEDALNDNSAESTGSKSVGDMCRATKLVGGSIVKIISGIRTSPESTAPHAIATTDQIRTIIYCSKKFQGNDAEIRQLIEASQALARSDKAQLKGNSQALLGEADRVLKAARALPQDAALAAAIKDTSDAISAMIRGAVSGTANMGETHRQLEERANHLGALIGVASGVLPEHTNMSKAGLTAAQQIAQLLQALANIFDDPDDQQARTALTNAQKESAVALRALTQIATALAPAQKECDEAIRTTNIMLEDLEAIDFEIMSGAIGDRKPSRPGVEHDQFAQDLVRVATQLEAAAHRAADPSNPRLGLAVNQITQIIPDFTVLTKDTVLSSSGDLQSNRLGMCKSIGEHLVSMLGALQKVAVDSDDSDAAQRLGSELSALHRETSELSRQLQSTRLLLAECDAAAGQLASKALPAINAPLPQFNPAAGVAYNAAVNTLTDLGNQLNAILTELAKHASSESNKLGESATLMAALLCDRVAAASRHCASTISQAPLQQAVLKATDNMTRRAIAIIEASKVVIVDPADRQKQASLSGHIRDVRASIIELVNATKAGATGAKACEAASADVGEIIQKVDADYLYAAAGQMDVSDIDHSVSLGDAHSDALGAIAEAKRLAGTAATDKIRTVSQDELGKFATQLASTIRRTALSSKTMAVLLSDIGTQQVILQGVKNLAVAGQTVIMTAKKLHDDPSNASAAEQNAFAQKSFAEAGERLVQIANSSSAEIIASQKALESAKSRVADALRIFANAGNPGASNATPDSIVVTLRALAKQSADIVSAASSSQAELIRVAGEMADTGEALVANIKGAFKLTPNAAIHKSLTAASGTNCERVIALLEALRQQHANDPQSFFRVSDASNKLADSLHETVVAARALPGGENLELEENDLGSLAEKELLAAAEAIEAAAARLLRLPKRGEKSEFELMDEQDIAEAILVAARAITDATRSLVQSATSVQRELQAAGKGNPQLNVYKKDPAWAMGLISAAQSVSGSVELLVETANATAKESTDENESRLIAAVHMVGGATARLVSASRVKADPNSPSQARLEAAAKAVANATKKLSEAARSRDTTAGQSAQQSEASLSAVARRRQELEKQAEIERLRKQLEAAEKGVFDMRRDDYSESRSVVRPGPSSSSQPSSSSSPSSSSAPSSSSMTRGTLPPRGARGRGFASIPPAIAPPK